MRSVGTLPTLNTECRREPALSGKADVKRGDREASDEVCPCFPVELFDFILGSVPMSFDRL